MGRLKLFNSKCLKLKLKYSVPKHETPSSFYTRANRLPSLNSSIILDPNDMTQIISLSCPISLTRQETPVRTTSCRHLQTVDLSSMVDTLRDSQVLSMVMSFKFYALFKCPVCTLSGSLYVDCNIRNILLTTSPWWTWTRVFYPCVFLLPLIILLPSVSFLHLPLPILSPTLPSVGQGAGLGFKVDVCLLVGGEIADFLPWTLH